MELDRLLELEEVILWNLSFNISVKDSLKGFHLTDDEIEVLMSFIDTK